MWVEHGKTHSIHSQLMPGMGLAPLYLATWLHVKAMSPVHGVHGSGIVLFQRRVSVSHHFQPMCPVSFINFSSHHRDASFVVPHRFPGGRLPLAMAPSIRLAVRLALVALTLGCLGLGPGQLFSLPASGVRSPNSPIPRNAMNTLDRATG